MPQLVLPTGRLDKRETRTIAEIRFELSEDPQADGHSIDSATQPRPEGSRRGLAADRLTGLAA